MGKFAGRMNAEPLLTSVAGALAKVRLEAILLLEKTLREKNQSR
jgi:hypothetical protein